MEQPQVDHKGIKGFLRGFGYAASGIAHVIKTQLNMKVHICFAIFALVMCAILRCTVVEWAIVIALIGIVFAAEIFNTAIEATVDLACPQIDPKAKIAKDAAAGAVLVLAIASVVIGLAIYISAFLRIIG